MQEAIPYSTGTATWPALDMPTSSSSSPSLLSSSVTTSGSMVRGLVAENPVLVVGRRGCCMCHVVKRLLQGLGVNPAVCEVGDEIDDEALTRELSEIDRNLERPQQQQQKILFPAVFIGGRLIGGLDRLMAVHISGELVPILKEAGALWL